MALPPKRQRSRRQRKKMRVDEFQELGFEYEVQFQQELPPEEQEALMDRFLTEVIEPRNLGLGGWLSEGFVSPFVRGSATEADRVAVQDWLTQNIKGATVKLSDFKDAWYVEA